MTKPLVRLFAPILLLGLAAAPASAAQTFYVSLMAGQVTADDWDRINSNFSNIVSPGTVDSSNSSATGYRGALGYRFADNVGVEIDYVDAGEFTIDSDAITDARYVSERRHVGGYLVGFAPIGGSSELYAKIGAAHWEANSRFTTLAGALIVSEKSRGTDLSYGAGFNYHITRYLDATFGYTRVKMNVTGGYFSFDEYLVGVNLGF